MLKHSTRITVAFDKSTANLLAKISRDARLSQSEIMRRALRFYHENKILEDSSTRKKIYTYMDMLLNGEHVILDVDHWFLLLGLIESSPEKETFWSEHREVARSHTEQLRSKVHTAEEMLARLETCNFFRMTQDSENTFTLILGSEIPKKFIRIFLEEFFSAMGVKAKIKENLAKLRVTVGPS